MICELCRTPNARGDRCGPGCPMHHDIMKGCPVPKHPSVQTHAAELNGLFVGCLNEVLALVGVADRCDPEEVPADLVAFVEKVWNDALDEAANDLDDTACLCRPTRAKVLFSAAKQVRALKFAP